MHVHHLIRFKQAPFIFEYVNMLNEKRSKSKTTVEKNLYKLLAYSIYVKFVETELKRMKVKFDSTWNERETIIQKHGYDMIAGTTMYFENLIGIKMNTTLRKVVKPFFNGFAILDMSKHIIYDFFYMCSRRQSITWSCWDRTRTRSSYNWVTRALSSTRCVMCTSRLNSRNSITRVTSMDNLWTITNKKCTRAYFLRSHPSSTLIRSCLDQSSRKNTMDIVSPSLWDSDRRCTVWLMRRMLYTVQQREYLAMSWSWWENEREEHWFVQACTWGRKEGRFSYRGSFKRLNNQGFDINTKEQTKTLMTCTDIKRWILDDNVHTLAFGHYRLKDM